MKKTLRLLFIFFLSTNCHAAYEGLKFDQTTLNKYAKDFGNKFGNLELLTKLSEKFNVVENLGSQVKVPIFAGISSSNIKKFIKEKSDLDLNQEWKKLLEKHYPETESHKRDGAYKEKQYTQEFLEELSEIENKIKTVFEKIVNEIDKTKFSFNKSFDAKNVDETIAKVRETNERLMVRSTGKEDSKELANAGGNESVANVIPDVKSILHATGKVVASYFSSKSLNQRLGAGDPSIFTEKEPFTPVLIQRMIGEKRGEPLPKCGVMFTEETEGGISKLNKEGKDGKIETTGNTIVQSAYGHNEGVVNSLIPVDTFYVIRINGEIKIYLVIKPKTHRIKPDPKKSGQLDMVENKGLGKEEDFILQQSPSLTKKELIILKKFSDALENYYLIPMDVEFVIVGGIIYIVQARPIVHNKKKVEPSYLVNPDGIPSDQKTSGQAIGVAGGALRFITQPSQIVIAENIGKALNIYLYDKEKVPNRDNVQVIIVGKSAPITSHEATQFRSEGKPVIYIKDWQKIEEWLKSNKIKIVVDPQQGLIVNWQGAQNSVGDLLEDKKVAKKGWVSYPIPLLASLAQYYVKGSPIPAVPNRNLDENFIRGLLGNDALFNKLKGTNVVPQKDWLKFAKEQFKKIKKLSQQDAFFALAKLLYQLHKLIENKKSNFDKQTQEWSNLLQSYIVEYSEILKKVLNLNTDDPKRLFALRFLEALLFQKSSPQEIVNGLSATVLLKGLKLEQTIIQKLIDKGILKSGAKVSSKLMLLLLAGDLALTPELEKNWTTFVSNLNEKQLNSFNDLFLKLGNLGIVPVWLHTSFEQKYGSGKGSQEVLNSLKKEYEADQQFLEQMAQKKKK